MTTPIPDWAEVREEEQELGAAEVLVVGDIALAVNDEPVWWGCASFRSLDGVLNKFEWCTGFYPCTECEFRDWPEAAAWALHWIAAHAEAAGDGALLVKVEAIKTKLEVYYEALRIHREEGVLEAGVAGQGDQAR